MKAGRLITHGLAIGVGFAAAFAFAGKATVKLTETAVEERRSFSRHAHARPEKIRPREMLRSLANVPMESRERENLKYEIYSEWSEQDPLGFLAHFEHRPLFNGYLNGYRAFSTLARTQPEELLAYARRTGCKEAAVSLVDNADPSRVLELLKLDGCERFPKELIKNLARNGAGLDPHFHEKLAGISDPEARKIALAEAASGMKWAGRIDDLLTLVHQHPEALEPAEAGRNIGVLMLQDRRELGRLNALESDVREAAVGEIIGSIHDDGVSEQGQREILADLATRGLLDSKRKDVFEAVMEAGDISNESAVAWKDWALSLPGSAETRPLQLASMVLWSISTKAGAGTFATLPEGELRDAVVVGGVGHCLQDENLPEARTMAGLIRDPGLREKMEGYLTQMEKGEEPEDFDPFGFGEQ